MVSNTEITNKALEKAQLRYEQAKQKLAAEMAKAKEERRRAETHHKCVMGGLVAKYLPECYQFEESELNSIIRAAIQSSECKNAIMKVKITLQGMCCDFAIHDSENKKTYQRNLHCHIMLTMRPLTKEGEWGDKQHFIYRLDKDGNRIRKKNGKGYEGHSEPTTDWNSKDKAAEWRKDLADTINSVNERVGNTENVWEHRSFRERGLDIIPEVHLGAKACALENRGVRTERGDINRKICLLNSAVSYARDNYLSAKKALDDILAKPAGVVRKAKTEITGMLDKVQARMGRLALPIVSAKYLAKIPNRERVQDIDNAQDFLERNSITTFHSFNSFRVWREEN